MIIKEMQIPYRGFPPNARDDSRMYRIIDSDGRLSFEKRSNRLDRLQHEASLLIALKGIGGVPQFHELNGPDEQGFFGLRVEYSRGNLLSEVSETLSTVAILRLFLRTLRTLLEVHRRGVVHGDVRPWNVICDDRQAVLIDFEQGLGELDLPGPIAAYRARRSRRDEVHAVLRDLKDLLSTVLFAVSVSRSCTARWLTKIVPAVVRKFKLPPPGHGVYDIDNHHRG